MDYAAKLRATIEPLQQNVAGHPLPPGDSAPRDLASTRRGAHNLYAGKPAWQGTVASNLASTAYLTGKHREAMSKHVARRRLFIKANRVIAGCLLFWLAVAVALAAPDTPAPQAGPGFEICTNRSC